MVKFLFLAVATVAIVWIVWLVAALGIFLWHEYEQDRRQARLQRELHRADDQLAAALRDAKKQMNQAAGQSWRNRFE
ncbi:hypothetical protein [Flexivirga caeni]|uniref:Uncharacterized protein n=1 Tax=Flexivirga caeni TaxID=2294115 RepID=A0A3M9LVQ1_9MICO|nr:hypothetical protein [Flexivirga caeni]RNI17025.1 hypothetical protein EFY87_19735 [Flexivirga caeni]